MAKKDEIKVIRISITTGGRAGYHRKRCPHVSYFADTVRMGTGTNPNPAPDTSEHPYECSDEDVNVLLQFCSNGRCVNLMGVWG